MEKFIINTGAIVEHDVQIGDNTHISTGAIINGEVEVGKNVFIGSGTIIVNNVKIKSNSFIKAGTLIKIGLKNLIIIAEVGVNHNGNISLAKKLINMQSLPEQTM